MARSNYGTGILKLVEVVVKQSTRDKIREAKQGKTYDQFLIELLEKTK